MPSTEGVVAAIVIGWGRLALFLTGTLMLIMTGGAFIGYIDHPHQSTPSLGGAAFATLWFTAELIWVPESVFGNSGGQNSLIYITRRPWRVSMGVLGLIASCGYTGDGKAFSVDISGEWLKWISIVFAFSSAFAMGSVLIWPVANTSSGQGWCVKRWYEGVPGGAGASWARWTIARPGWARWIIAGTLVACPTISLVSEITGALTELSLETASSSLASLALDSALVYEAYQFGAIAAVQPIHLSTLLGNLFVLSRSTTMYGNLIHMMFLVPVTAYVFVEVYFGKQIPLSEYTDAVVMWSTNYNRTLYRASYVGAVWCGIAASVTWGIGWNGDWLDIDVEIGPVIEDVLTAMNRAAEAVATFIVSVIAIANSLDACDLVSSPAALQSLPSSLALLDKGQGGKFTKPITSGSLRVFDITGGQGGSTRKYHFSPSNDKEAPGRTCEVSSSCFDEKSKSECTEDNIHLSEIALGARQVTMSYLVDRPGCDLGKTYNDLMEERQAMGGGEVEIGAVELDGRTLSAKYKKRDAEEGLTYASACDQECQSDPDRWIDHDAEHASATASCRDTACTVFITVLAASAASAFIPFIGGAISFTAKTAGRILYGAFKMALWMAKLSLRFFFKLSRFFIKVAKLGRTLSGGGGVQKASYDLVYVFTPIFGVSIVSAFVGFWRREDAGDAKSLMRGLLVGLLFANVCCISMVHFLPFAIQLVANGMPDELLVITVRTGVGWDWMIVASGVSGGSCVLWCTAMYLEYSPDTRIATIGAPHILTYSAVTHSTRSDPRKTSYSAVGLLPIVGAPRKASDRVVGPVGAPHTSINFATLFNMLIWLTPTIVLAVYVVSTRMEVLTVTYNAKTDVLRDVGDLQGEESLQDEASSVKQWHDENLCDLVAKSIWALVEDAAHSVGPGLLVMADAVTAWFQSAFYRLRTLLKEILDVPMLQLSSVAWWGSVGLVLGCPVIAWLLVAGVAIKTGLSEQPPRVLTNALVVFVGMLGGTGLSISLTIVGFASVLASFTLPVVDVKVQLMPLVTYSIFSNILVLMSYASARFNSAVPLDTKVSLL